MITISLCMIVKNEEEVLGRCLASVKDLVDEIIIVDTGSDDQTKEIASGYTDKVFSYQWSDDFSAARNYAFSKASMNFCMWLDADDVMEEKDRLDFAMLKSTVTPETDIVMMRYNTAFDEENNPTFWYYRERLIRNNGKHRWEGAVHEAIVPNGTVLYSDVSVAHKKMRAGNPDRNLNIYEKMLSDGKKLGTRESYYYARELYYHRQYEKAIDTLNKFLSFEDAWVENRIEACIILSRCYRSLNNGEAALKSLLKSLEYDVPRAEVCCEIGNHFMESSQYETAVFWYETALNCRMDTEKGGFIETDCYQFIPAMQLCVCFDKLGQRKRAMEYNDLAGSFKPNSPAYLYNKSYFDKML